MGGFLGALQLGAKVAQGALRGYRQPNGQAGQAGNNGMVQTPQPTPDPNDPNNSAIGAARQENSFARYNRAPAFAPPAPPTTPAPTMQLPEPTDIDQGGGSGYQGGYAGPPPSVTGQPTTPDPRMLRRPPFPGGEGYQGLPTAHGGIFTKPTRVLLGERGPEAVVPLRPGAGNMGAMPMPGMRPMRPPMPPRIPMPLTGGGPLGHRTVATGRAGLQMPKLGMGRYARKFEPRA